jgi:hypothetical protein
MSRKLKSKTYFKELSRFLPHSELNVRMARLAVLFEDLRLEAFAIVAPELPKLDFNKDVIKTPTLSGRPNYRMHATRDTTLVIYWKTLGRASDERR